MFKNSTECLKSSTACFCYNTAHAAPISQGKKHIWQAFVTSELKIELFCFFTIDWHYGMNFHSCEKQIFKYFGFTKILNDSKWTKRSWNELMQSTTSNSHSRSISHYHVHDQAGFDSPIINERGFIYLDISKLSFTFKYLQEFKVAYQ